MQKRPKGKHGVEIVLHQTELIQLQVLDCSLLVLKLERKKSFFKYYEKNKYKLEKVKILSRKKKLFQLEKGKRNPIKKRKMFRGPFRILILRVLIEFLQCGC